MTVGAGHRRRVDEGAAARPSQAASAAAGGAAALAVCVACFAFPLASSAAAACPPADASVAGFYVLRGVMEVGSELRLRADGRFDYMLAYGALDELATGCWSRKGDVVTLTASRFEANMDDPAKFRRLTLKLTPKGDLERRFDADHVGRYARE